MLDGDKQDETYDPHAPHRGLPWLETLVSIILAATLGPAIVLAASDPLLWSVHP